MAKTTFVKAIRMGGKVVFGAFRLEMYDNRPTMFSLAWKDECVVYFDTFQEANNVVMDYLEPPYDMVQGRWDTNTIRWVVVESVQGRENSEREDFHSDG